jgi:hypothetical protein
MEDAMCHHINALGQFQSDQYPDMPPDEIVLSFRDPASIEALHAFADLTEDDDLAVAIMQRLDAIAEVYVQGMRVRRGMQVSNIQHVNFPDAMLEFTA